MKVVSIGGGNGQSQVAGALVKTQAVFLDQGLADFSATFITTAFDDGFSTGELRKKNRCGGYYGDVTRILGALRSAVFGPKDPLAEIFASRFASGIGGHSLGDLCAKAFGPQFQAYSHDTVQTLVRILRIENIEDDMIRDLLIETLTNPVAFDQDDFPHHSFRNLLLFQAERVALRRGLRLGDALRAVHRAYRIPRQFKVVPVTWEFSQLKARTTILGEELDRQYWIDAPDRRPSFKMFDKIGKLWIDPVVSTSCEATEALSDADAIVISCGSLGNFVAPFLVEGMKEALHRRKEEGHKKGVFIPVICVMNLMTKVGETQFFNESYSADRIVDLIHGAIGYRPTCIIFDTTPIPEDVQSSWLPERHVELGELTEYVGSRQVERPSLLQREVARLVPDEERPAGFLKLVHDPEKLGVVLAEALSQVLVGALA